MSSDSDFTCLATRIRESGLIAYGLGEQKNPKPFVADCDKFIYTENLVHLDQLVPYSDNLLMPGYPSLETEVQNDKHLISQLRTIVEAISGDEGWARLSDVDQLLTHQKVS